MLSQEYYYDTIRSSILKDLYDFVFKVNFNILILEIDILSNRNSFLFLLLKHMIENLIFWYYFHWDLMLSVGLLVRRDFNLLCLNNNNHHYPIQYLNFYQAKNTQNPANNNHKLHFLIMLLSKQTYICTHDKLHTSSTQPPTANRQTNRVHNILVFK